MVGGTLLQPQSVLPVTWQATIKPYKHQITDLGRVDVVIFPENFFFCCENSGVKRGKNPTGAPRPTLPTPACWPPQAKRIHTCAKQENIVGRVICEANLKNRDIKIY